MCIVSCRNARIYASLVLLCSKQDVQFKHISDNTKDLHLELDEAGLPAKREVRPTDVSQGALGDCYYLAAIAALAEKPEILRSLFATALPSKGLYAVRLNFGGIEVLVALDDEFAFSQRGRYLSFAKAPTNPQSHLWVMLLEKAYAKLHGSYQAIEGGYVHEALADLTGGLPGKLTLSREATDDVWDKLKQLSKVCLSLCLLCMEVFFCVYMMCILHACIYMRREIIFSVPVPIMARIQTRMQAVLC